MLFARGSVQFAIAYVPAPRGASVAVRPSWWTARGSGACKSQPLASGLSVKQLREGNMPLMHVVAFDFYSLFLWVFWLFKEYFSILNPVVNKHGKCITYYHTGTCIPNQALYIPVCIPIPNPICIQTPYSSADSARNTTKQQDNHWGATTPFVAISCRSELVPGAATSGSA